MTEREGIVDMEQDGADCGAATQFAFDEDMGHMPPCEATLGRAAPRQGKGNTNLLPDRPYWETRPFPPLPAPPVEEPKQPAAREPPAYAYAPFGRVPALPGVDVPAPPPFARPRADEVITIQDDDVFEPPGRVVTIHDKEEGQDLVARPRSRRGSRRPRPSASAASSSSSALVIDVDADDSNNVPERGQRAPRKSRSPRLARPPDAPPPRLGRSLYDAVQTHGHFGMVDSGESDGGLRRLVVHVPKRSRGYILDIRPGEVIHANSARGKAVGGRLEVKYVTRHQYFAPGRAVTSCVIGVPEWQWERFM